MFIVTGASGRLGRLTVQHLRERVDAAKIVAVTRTPAEAADLGVTVRPGDFDDPASLKQAFAGAERVLIISTGALGRRVRQHTAAITAAAEAGAAVLYTSMTRAGEPGNPLALIPEHRETERFLAGAGTPFTILRNAVYMDMLALTLPLREIVDTGVLVGRHGTGFVSYVTREDLAAATAALLAGGGHDGQILELSGPQALDHAGIAAALAAATGRPVRYDPSADEDREALLRRLPPEVRARGAEAAVEAGLQFWRTAAAGWFDVHTHHIPRLTGRPSTTLTEFLATTF